VKNLLILLKLWVFISLSGVITAHARVSEDTLEAAKKAIVTIESRIAASAYNNIGSWTGTGFINDTANGFIITNSHVIGRASIGTYFVTFHNGQQAEAKLAYYDSWQDYAILKVEKNEIPISATQIVFSKVFPKQNQSVLIVGNAEGQGFSFHTGYLSSLYEINGDMPQCSYVINLNSTGGASGSPILNDKNEAIGILYGGGKTHVLGLHAEYPQRALDSLKNGKIPTRNHIGIITELYSLDKAVKHRAFPKKEMEKFLKQFPDTRNRVVEIKTIIPGSTAEDFLKAGDIIWEINGTPLGGSLAVLDIAMDMATDKVKLVIYREGKKIELAIDLYNVNANKIESMINFSGATFFEADDYSSAKSGIPLKALTIANVQAGSSFSVIPTYFTQDYRNLYRINIHSIGNHKITSLNDLIKQLPLITQEKFVTVKFTNYQPYFAAFSGSIISAHADMVTDIVFDSIYPSPMKVLEKSLEIGYKCSYDKISTAQ